MPETWEVRCHYRNTLTNPQQCAQNTLYVLAPGGVGDVRALAEAVRAAWEPVVWLMSADVEWEGVTCARVGTGGSPMVKIELLPHVVGREIGQTLPSGVAVEAIKRTGVYGKAFMGKVFIPWTLQNMMSPDWDNQIAEGSALAFEAALNGSTAAFAAGAGGGPPLIPVVYSRRAGSGVRHSTPIVNYEVKRAYGNLTKRGRRASYCPPFVETPVTDGGLTIRSPLLPFGWDAAHSTTYPVPWKFLETRYGNPLPAEPVGWQYPDYDDSGWTGFEALINMGGQPPEPYSDFPTTYCLAQPTTLPGIINPPDWHAAPRPDLPWAKESPSFRGIYWATMDVDHLHAQTWPDLGDAYFRCRFNDALTGPVITAQMDLYAVDSAEVWIDGERVIDQPDDEKFSGHLAHWDYLPVGDRLGPGDHVLAIHVRARRSYHDPLCPGMTLPLTGGNRIELLYGDCHFIDFLCNRDTIFGVPYDQFFGLSQGCCLRIWTQSAPPGTPVVE